MSTPRWKWILDYPLSSQRVNAVRVCDVINVHMMSMHVIHSNNTQQMILSINCKDKKKNFVCPVAVLKMNMLTEYTLYQAHVVDLATAEGFV